MEPGQAMKKSASIPMMDAPEYFSIISTNQWKVLLSKQLEHMKEKENVRILIVDDENFYFPWGKAE